MPIIKYITAALQARKANKINTTRPIYNIPKEVLQNQQMYGNMANTSRMPGQSIAENNIGANSAASINAAMQAGGNSGDILATLGNINNNSNQQLNNLALQGAQFQNQAKDKLAQANESLAEYRDQAFDYNQNQPYELNVMRQRALRGAANANFDSANNDMHEAGMSFLGFACFHPDTPIRMIDGSEKPISEIEIGDETLGGIVDGVHTFKVCRLLNYQGVLVTGSHAVFEGKKWIRVGESEHTSSTEILSVVYNLTTREHRIFVHDIMFADQDEVGVEEQNVINNHCLSVLNS